MNRCKISIIHRSQATLEMFDLWYRSGSRWLIYSHFSFFFTLLVASLTKRRAFQSHSPGGVATTTVADKHLFECSSSCSFLIDMNKIELHAKNYCISLVASELKGQQFYLFDSR